MPKKTKPKPKRHDHRQSLWLIAGGFLLWCYRCGAFRDNLPGKRPWHKPTGLTGDNPAMKEGWEP